MKVFFDWGACSFRGLPRSLRLVLINSILHESSVQNTSSFGQRMVNYYHNICPCFPGSSQIEKLALLGESACPGKASAWDQERFSSAKKMLEMPSITLSSSWTGRRLSFLQVFFPKHTNIQLLEKLLQSLKWQLCQTIWFSKWKQGKVAVVWSCINTSVTQ